MRKMSTRRRLKIFNAAKGICHICEQKIQVGEAWDADHVIALEVSRDDSDDNIRPAHSHCHKIKTAGDVKTIAKCKRVQAKHRGAKKSTWPKSRWKKKVDGSVVRREND